MKMRVRLKTYVELQNTHGVRLCGSFFRHTLLDQNVAADQMWKLGTVIWVKRLTTPIDGYTYKDLTNEGCYVSEWMIEHVGKKTYKDFNWG